MLGVPPNTEHVFFSNPDVEWNQKITFEWMKKNGFEVRKITSFTISADLKFRHTFLSLFSMGKPLMDWHVLFTEEGRITIKSSYDYDSIFGVAFNDLGRQRRYIKELEENFKSNQ